MDHGTVDIMIITRTMAGTTHITDTTTTHIMDTIIMDTITTVTIITMETITIHGQEEDTLGETIITNRIIKHIKVDM